MNYLVFGFFVVLLTARFFSETLRVIPKAFDLVDLVFIPLLTLGALFGGSLKGVDRQLHGRLLKWTGMIVGLAVVSAIVNFTRTHYAPTMLFIFGIAAGPALYLALNRLVRRKEQMARQTGKFLYVMFLIEGAVVLLVSLPTFFATGNPDYVSGTFGLNAYQFSALLVIIGGYFLGKMRFDRAKLVVGIAIQLGVVVTFLLLQYRTATPAFFAAYLALLGLLYGRRVFKLTMWVGVMGIVGFLGFQFIKNNELGLKFDDLATLAQNPQMATNFGKVIAYGNTFSMYADQPGTVIFGAGPGTMVSRSAYTFIIEPLAYGDKGVGGMVTRMFPDVTFRTDVFAEYIEPLFGLETVFGSDQANNPASSILTAMAELGIPGLVLLVLLYGTMIRQVIRYARFAIVRADPEIVPLAGALVTGAVYLILLAPLDNYLEIARVTLPVWLLFWTVSALVHHRKQQENLERFAMAMQLNEQAARTPAIHVEAR